MTPFSTQKEVTGFASTAPGLEPVVLHELSQWSIDGTIEAGGVQFTAPLNQFLRLSTMLRCPSRLLLRIARGSLTKLADLHALLNQPMLQAILPKGVNIELRISCRHTLLRSDILKSKAVRMLRAILQGSPDGPTQTIFLRVQGKHADLSIDPLRTLRHKRGWRLEQGKAPLRENWAATLLTMAGWQAEEPLIDPFCGSGTIPIEATLMAHDSSPFVDQKFAFMDWNIQTHTPPATTQSPHIAFIQGSDQHLPSLDWASRNAQRAGVVCEFKHRDISALSCEHQNGLIVCNPPYGKRIGQNVQQCYRWLGKRLRHELSTWRAIFLAPNERLARQVDQRVQSLCFFKNGGQQVGVWTLEPVELTLED